MAVISINATTANIRYVLCKNDTVLLRQLACSHVADTIFAVSKTAIMIAIINPSDGKIAIIPIIEIIAANTDKDRADKNTIETPKTFIMLVYNNVIKKSKISECSLYNRYICFGCWYIRSICTDFKCVVIYSDTITWNRCCCSPYTNRIGGCWIKYRFLSKHIIRKRTSNTSFNTIGAG